MARHCEICRRNPAEIDRLCPMCWLTRAVESAPPETRSRRTRRNRRQPAAAAPG